MNKVAYERLSWKDDGLYYNSTFTGISLEQDKKHKNMYWLVGDLLPKGRSIYYYNLTTAKDNGKVFYMKLNNETEDSI